MPSEVEFVPKNRWDILPVQPTAAAWRARKRLLTLASAAAVVWAAIVTIVAINGPADSGFHPWEPWTPLVFVVLPCIIAAAQQARAARAERDLGYTTLPT